jgi:hypothetical protein
MQNRVAHLSHLEVVDGTMQQSSLTEYFPTKEHSETQISSHFPFWQHTDPIPFQCYEVYVAKFHSVVHQPYSLSICLYGLISNKQKPG